MLYYKLLQEGLEHSRLLESIVNFNLAELISNSSPLMEVDIIKKLDLHPLRAKKCLSLLTREKFLNRIENSNEYAYSLVQY